MLRRLVTGSLSPRAGIWPLLLALALSVLVLWLLRPLTDPLQANAGHDFMIIYGAARVLRDHRNPYDPAILLPYVHMTGIPLNYLLNGSHQLDQPYAYPPLVAWLVVPLTYLSPPAALFVWRLIESAGMLAGTYGMTAPFRNMSAIFSTRPRRLAFACLVLAAPMTVYGLYWGNPVALVYAALGGAVWALARGETWSDIAAGALMSVTLLKPHLALPLAILAAGCFLQGGDAWQRRRRVGYGFLGAILLLLAIDLLATGPMLLLDWPRSILFLSHLAQSQGDMPSLLGLLQTRLRYLSGQRYLEISAMIVGLSLVLVVVLFWRLKRVLTQAIVFGLLTVVWCFGSPYAHANDDILLVPGGLALLTALSGLAVEWTRQGISFHPPGGARRLANDGVCAALSALALGALYLGGVSRYVHYHAHRLPSNLAIGLGPLVLLIALGVAVPTFARQREAAGRLEQRYRTARALPAARRTDAPG